MAKGFFGGCVGAIACTVLGILALWASGMQGDGQAGMIVFVTIPIGAYLGTNWRRWRRK